MKVGSFLPNSDPLKKLLEQTGRRGSVF